MDTNLQHQANQAAYRRLKNSLAQDYPAGRFVAIADGRVVADAERLDVLHSALKAMGKDPSQVLVVQAGVDYPETAVIFLRGGPP
jgi:hypothetical protein